MQRPFYVYRRWHKRLTAFLFDALGGLFFFPARCFSGRLTFEKVKRILVIRLDHLGDVVMTRPALKALERIFPEARIDLLVSEETAPLLKDSAAPGEILAAKNHWFGKSVKPQIQWAGFFSLLEILKKKNYDLAIDFRGDLRNILLMFLAGIPLRLGFGITGGGFLLSHQGLYDPRKHRVELNAELLKFFRKHFELKPEPFLYSEARKKEFWARTGMIPQDGRRRILIHPAASCPSKQWPLARFQRLIEKIREENLGRIILAGTSEEKKIFMPECGGEILDLRGETSIGDLPVLIAGCDLFIGNDSGPAHIAAAQGKYGVSIFSGTNLAEAWRPWSPRLRLIGRAVSCSPCEARVCPLGHHQCMEEISVDEVLRAVKSVLNELSQARQAADPSPLEKNAAPGAVP